jgi:hypothetical protein
MAGYPIWSFALPSRRNDKALRREFYADAKQKKRRLEDKQSLLFST